MLKIVFAAVLTFLSLSLLTQASAVGVGQRCGGLPNVQCDAGMFCEKRPGLCNVVDTTGRCVKIPQVCLLKKSRLYRPVCGCNGATYSNDCQRQAAAVSKNHEGPCK